MHFEQLISGPCALPNAPLAMPTQQLEYPEQSVFALFASLRLIHREPA